MPDAKRVLVVEDDPAIRRLLADTLADEGHDVRQAMSGPEALDVLEVWLPDVILLDIALPGMDGRVFRTHQTSLAPPASDVPVIIVTGTHDYSRLTSELGAAALLRKPFDLDELVELVSQVAG